MQQNIQYNGNQQQNKFDEEIYEKVNIFCKPKTDFKKNNEEKKCV